jgi:DNA-binding NarL/FixJ family response regulator
MNTLHAVISEDDLLWGEMLAIVLEKKVGVQVSAQLPSLAAAAQYIWEPPPRLVIVDWALPDGTAKDFIGTLHDRAPGASWLGLTGTDDPKIVQKMIEAGFNGIVTKTARVAEICDAARALLNGDAFYSQNAARLMGAKYNAPLTPTEKTILCAYAQHASVPDTARRLGYSEKTVYTHLATTRAKLRARNNAELVRVCVERRICA